MEHELTLLLTITIAFVVALAFGLVASRLRLPPIIGYLVAGVGIGPFTPGFVADIKLAGQLAEIGVILLLFGVGLHFSLADLLAVRRIAITGALAQIALATAVGTFLMTAWGWSLGAGLTLGLSISVASTVVLLKALEEKDATESTNGRIAIGWLIVEDLAMVLALVILPVVAGLLGGNSAAPAVELGEGFAVKLLVTFAKIAAFFVLLLWIGPRVLPGLLRRVARTGSRELFTLTILAIALGIALGSAALFGVSFALGAFVAGMVLSESELSHKAAVNLLPLQDAFSVLFFVSIGMIFDPTIVVREPLMTLSIVGLIVIGKGLISTGIILLLRYPMHTALMVSASLAQVGEFSFILGGLGVRYGVLPAEGLNLILAGALISITLNPLVFAFTDWASGWFDGPSGWRAWLGAWGHARFSLLEQDLKTVREKAPQHAAEQAAFNPRELAGRFPLFAKLTHEQCELLSLHFRSHEFSPGDKILRSGAKADAVYFIAAGKVAAKFGGQVIELGAGNYFGEIELLRGKKHVTDVTAVDYTKLLALDETDFRLFLRKLPGVRTEITSQLAVREKGIQTWLEEKIPDE